MTNSPSISVIIPTYNASATLARALLSVRAQTCDGILETLVVDDGSDDDPAAMLRGDFPEVTWLRCDRGGVAAARNRAAEVAQGQYLAFLDADDAWLPDKLSRQLALLRDYPQAPLALTSIRRIDEQGVRERMWWRRVAPAVLLRPADWLDQTLLRRLRLYPTCSSWLLRRDVFAALGGFAPWRIMSDLEFLVRLAGAGHAAAVLTAPLVEYYYREASLCHALTCQEQQARLDTRLELLDQLGEQAVARGDLTRERHDRLRRERYVYRGLVHLRYGGVGGAAELVERAAAVPQSSCARLRLAPLRGTLRLLRRTAGEEWRTLDHVRRLVRPWVWRL